MALEDRDFTKEALAQDYLTEEHSFDEIAKGLANGTLSRRQALNLFAGALFGGNLPWLIPGVV